MTINQRNPKKSLKTKQHTVQIDVDSVTLRDTYLTALVASITSKLNRTNDFTIQRYTSVRSHVQKPKDVYETILITAHMRNRIKQSYYDQLTHGSDALDFDLELYVLYDGTILCEKMLSGVTVYTKQMLHDLLDRMKGSGWSAQVELDDDTYEGFVYFAMDATPSIRTLRDVATFDELIATIRTFVERMQSFVDMWGTRTYRMQASCDFNMRRMIRRAFHRTAKVQPAVPALAVSSVTNPVTGQLRPLPMFCVDIQAKNVTSIQLQALYFESQTHDDNAEYVVQLLVPVVQGIMDSITEALHNVDFMYRGTFTTDEQGTYMIIENEQPLTNVSAWLRAISQSYPLVQSLVKII